jgi:hypothetical protein
MKLTNALTGETLNRVVIGLTREEAEQLRFSLKDSIENPGTEGHNHISNEDYSVEISVWVIPDPEA